MCRQIVNLRHTPYSICLVCEGEKTEPFFYLSLVRDLGDVDYHLDTDPVVRLGEPIGVNSRAVRHLALMNGGTLPAQAHLPYPLNFVEIGKRYLDSEMHHEVWVIYDKDNHPAHAEAWRSAVDYRNQTSNKLNLVFSSRCIEYYLLEHFEYIDRAFSECECKGQKAIGNGRFKTVEQNCCRTDRKQPLANACDGVNNPCINGYARHHGYWLNGEGKGNAAYGKVRNLWVGIYNAHRLKWWSLHQMPSDIPIYERNPYLNVYRLTLRLKEMSSLESGDVITTTNNLGGVIIERHGDIVTFTNEQTRRFVVGPTLIRKYRVPYTANGKWYLNQSIAHTFQCMLDTHESANLDLTGILGEDEFLLLKIGSHDYFCALEGEEIPDLIINEKEPTSALFTRR